MMFAHARRATVPSLRLAALLVAFGALTSCSDSTGTKTVSSVAKMHLVFTSGATVQTLDVTTNKEESRTVHVPTNVATTITGTFFRGDGSVDPTVTATAFKLIATVDVFGSSPPISYTPSATDTPSRAPSAPVPTLAPAAFRRREPSGSQLVNVSSGVTGSVRGPSRSSRKPTFGQLVRSNQHP